MPNAGESMIWFYELLFPAMWCAFLLYWRLMSFRVKAPERMESMASRVTRTILFLGALALLMVPRIPPAFLYRRFLFWPLADFYVGAAITAAGLLFAVWARVHLGTNWSQTVMIKRDHELITSGPYHFARHPIYTGILTGFLGTAIALSQVRGLVAFLLVAIALTSKLRLEEQWMKSHFGATYEAYARRVPALVPRPW